MQLIPATFTAYAVDADRDGISYPHDIDDATAPQPRTSAPREAERGDRRHDRRRHR